MKVILTGDWHFGRDNDSRQHNDYLFQFIDFMTDYGARNGIDKIVQLGDYFDNRSKISLETLNCGIEAAKKVTSRGFDFYVITGNHDLFYKDRIDVSSTNALEAHCHLVREYTIIGDGMHATPWVTDGKAWDDLIEATQKYKADYLLGHFEFSNFKMNDHYVMEHGQSHRELRHLKRVVTGHYHMRQVVDNVVYVGTPFPFDFNDANDFDRGFMVLDTKTNKIEFINWGLVSILSVTPEEFIEAKAAGAIDEHTTVRVVVPSDASEELVEQISSELQETTCRSSKLNFKSEKIQSIMNTDATIKEVDNIDAGIIEALSSVQYNEDVDVELLTSLYKTATLTAGDAQDAN